MNTEPLKTAVKTLVEAIDQGQPDDLELDELVELGLLLARLTKHSKTLLEPIKDILRVEARERLDTQNEAAGDIVFQGGDGGQVVVKVGKATATLRKKADLLQLRKALNGQFPAFFKPEFKLQKAFDKAFQAADEGVRKAVLNVIDYPNPTPRVSFKD